MSSPHQNAIAGPSSQPFFPIPFRLDIRRVNENKKVTSTSSPRRPNPSTSSRSSTPIRPPLRARSSSNYSARTQVDEDAAQLDARRADSVRKMVDIWSTLGERYSAKLHEDDDIDICTGKLLADRGRIKKMIPWRDIGEGSEDDDEEETMTVVSENGIEGIDSDEDELGGWDVDPQTRSDPVKRVDSELDQEELRQFLMDEEERREMEEDEDEDQDADEEEGWTSDDESDGDGLNQSESSGGNQMSSTEEQDDSDDELLAVDFEASRVTPVPTRTRQNKPEVVIPLRSFSQSRRQPTSASPPSAQPSPRNRQIPSHPSIISPPTPTLDDLFTPPPERRAPIPKPSPIPITITRIPTKAIKTSSSIRWGPSPETSSWTAAEKGKGRMASECPASSIVIKRSTSLAPIADPEDVDPPSDAERYHSFILRLTKTATGFCRTCRQSSDPLRRDRAYYCKGRGKAISCTFAKELGEELVFARNRDSMAKLRARKRAAREASTPGFEVPESDDFEIMPSSTEIKKKARPRRASAAHMLRAKTPENGESVEEETSPAARLKELKEKRLQRARRAKTEQIPRVPLVDMTRSKSEVTPKSSPSILPVDMAPTQSMDSDPETWMLQVIQPSLPREMRDLTQDPFEIPPPSPPVRRPENQRPVKAMGNHSDVDESPSGAYRRPGSVRLTISSAPKKPITPSPPINASRPAVIVSDKRSARKRIMTPVSVSPAPDALGGSKSKRQSTPSPASSPPSHSSAHFSHPTPSPTASAEPDTSGATLLWPPTSPTRRRILPLPRGSHYAIHPTPPPSTDSRTSSLSSDRMRFERPRSILRGSSSTPNSAKRARFSLQPSSPGVDLSDIFAQSDNESQDYESEWQSSQDTEGSGQPSSPFFSTELSVRAADAGFQLGPGHTGRITPGMMQALYPKYGKELHGGISSSSPMKDDISESSPKSTPTALKPYTLHTPPRISTPSRSVRSPSKAGSTAGLMLPPPVPPKRLSSVSSSTPGPSTPGRSSSDPTPPAESLRTPPAPRRRPIPTIVKTEPRPITFKTALPPRIIHLQSQSRSRSRSVSAVPSSRVSSVDLGEEMTRRDISSSTPRKRYRDRSEREIARLARELGDDAGFEWGLDEDVGQDLAREGREGTVFMYSI